MNRTCYLCGNEKNVILFIEKGIPIVRCSNCGHVFSTFKQDEHYQWYWGEEIGYDLTWWDIAHREIYKNFIYQFLLSDRGRILDVGCGLGFFIKTINDNRPGWEAIGYDVSEKAVDYAKNRNNLKNVHSGIVQRSNLPKASFDIITLWDVIEHIPQPRSLIEYLFSLLKPNGFLFLQTPNFPVQLIKARLKVLFFGMKPENHYLEAKDHINNYSERTLKLLAEQCGFSSVEFVMLKPIASISGMTSKIGAPLKKTFYFFALLIWRITFRKVNINLTLFALLRKNNDSLSNHATRIET
ncbi:class I SAM-dependent methyltransferase [Leptospira inadai]|uniref:Class I SAM-dependent methyltransferase n=2 Tax=Leptospira inadai serovar Lyme TaxID=293084 RepID=A0ABX4YJN4_9LEPT|nr:class I SAM-dependent methyltransferase [Leptospira inadai]PNV75364.1 class I SAM-dependent methyltransferase [Leptospira inadai serovar Lyme]